MAEETDLTLRVCGLGHKLTLHVASSAPVGTLKSEVASHTGIPAAYQHLLARGVKLDDDESALSTAGLKDRTKIMLLHNALYAQEKDVFETLSAIEKDIDDLKASKNQTDSNVLSELVTRICCKLDEVDTKGSEHLRSFRKKLLGKAESIESADNPPTDT